MHRALSLLLALGGLYLVAWLGPRQLLDGARSSDWPGTTAVVTAVEVVRETLSSGSGHYYRVLLRYRYEVDGVEFDGSRYDASGVPDFQRRSDAESFADRYATGSEHLVRYDPADPSSAVISAGQGWRAWRNFGLGILLLALGGHEFLPRRRRP